MKQHFQNLDRRTGSPRRMEDRARQRSRAATSRVDCRTSKEFYFGTDTTGDGIIDSQGLRADRSTRTSRTIDARARSARSRSAPYEHEGRDRSSSVSVATGPYLQRGRGHGVDHLADGLCPDELDRRHRPRRCSVSPRQGPRSLGAAPRDRAQPIYVKVGRFGPYVQLGEPRGQEAEKPKRMSSLLPGHGAGDASPSSRRCKLLSACLGSIGQARRTDQSTITCTPTGSYGRVHPPRLKDSRAVEQEERPRHSPCLDWSGAWRCSRSRRSGVAARSPRSP